MNRNIHRNYTFIITDPWYSHSVSCSNCILYSY